MRKINASCVYPVSSEPIQNGLVITDAAGKILDLLSPEQPDYESALFGSEKFDGLLCPGFVNTHCHLELSYLKDKIEPHSGLNGFIQQLQKSRNNFSEELILNSIDAGEREMLKNGIVAVGDICNSSITTPQKSKSNLFYHSFVELFGFDETRAEDIFSRGLELNRLFEKNNLAVSISPHAPYSTSSKLMSLIAAHCRINYNLLTIHNQESMEENKLFNSKTGEMASMLKGFGYDLSVWNSYGKNSLPSYFPSLSTQSNILLVHNTYTSAEDIKSVDRKNVFWCFCPSANLYIENQLPQLSQFIESNVQITIGTDSLASNGKLSIWEELKTLKKHFPELTLDTLLKWGTLNGALFLGVEDKFGSIEKGKTPGLIVIDQIDTECAQVIRIC